MNRTSKRPLEFYGVSTDGDIPSSVFKAEECPFSGKRCFKVRKSEPMKTIGSCTVGYDGKPLIVCPNRFLDNDTIFKDVLPLLDDGAEYRVAPEISVPGGSVDYCVVSKDGDDIADFLGLEIQTLDTTGSGGIWKARSDYIQGKFGENYGYGINWKMTAKTILVQLIHKVRTFQLLNKRMVVVIQDLFYDYIKREFDASKVVKGLDNNPVIFHVYECRKKAGRYSINLKDGYSTDIGGLTKLLALRSSQKVKEQELIKRIEKKLPEGWEVK